MQTIFKAKKIKTNRFYNNRFLLNDIVWYFIILIWPHADCHIAAETQQLENKNVQAQQLFKVAHRRYR
jgi:hypothetical protein